MRTITKPVGKVEPSAIQPPESVDGKATMALVTSGKVIRPRRCLLYGEPGIGKSWWAAHSWKPVIIQTEEGCNDIDVPRFPLATTYEKVAEYVAAVSQGGHDFRTVVVDTIDWLEPMIFDVVASRAGVESVGDIGYNRGYQMALDIWRLFVQLLEDCRQAGMMVVLVGHVTTRHHDNPMCDSYDEFTLRIRKEPAALVSEWCDEVFFAHYLVDTTVTGESFGREKRRAVGGQKIMRCQQRPFALAKNRLGMPETVPFTFESYASAIKSNKESSDGKPS